MDFGMVVESLRQIFVQIINFIPNFINGLIILIVGYLVAWLVRVALTALLQRFDPLLERTGITGSLRSIGVTTPLSRILGQTIFALLLLSFLITSTRLMGLAAVALVLEQALGFLPNLIAALVVFLIGGTVARFAGNVVTTLVAGSGLSYAARAGTIIQLLINIFVVVFSLRALGIDTAILVTALSILLASFGLALGLGLGLGARSIFGHILAGYYLQQRLTVGQAIQIEQVDGDIGSIGSVNTAVNTAQGQVIVPNTRLLETMVTARPAATGENTPPSPPQG